MGGIILAAALPVAYSVDDAIHNNLPQKEVVGDYGTTPHSLGFYPTALLSSSSPIRDSARITDTSYSPLIGENLFQR